MARTAATPLSKTDPAAAGRQLIEPTAQALKSAKTRLRLIEATIRCLVKFGYANTTTPKVSEEAQLSRGAMLHHFDNGRQLMQATLAELHNKRLRAFRRAVDSIDHDARTLLQAYWGQLLRPNFIAFQELAMAARTDRQLAAILEPVQIEFRQRWHDLAIELFPEWQEDARAFEIALAFTQHTLEGMAINRITSGVDEDTIAMVLGQLEKLILDLRPKSKKA